MTAVYGLESIDGRKASTSIGYNIFKKDVTKVPRGMKLTMIRPSSLHRNWFGELPVVNDRSIRRMLLVVNVQLTRAYETPLSACTKQRLCICVRCLGHSGHIRPLHRGRVAKTIVARSIETPPKILLI
jgi:hypothetical protein